MTQSHIASPQQRDMKADVPNLRVWDIKLIK